jgi:ATP-dependent protease HslVU (ClpYQ) peptidase subunit
MTCIVGLVEGGVVYIGGDSMSVAGWDMGSTEFRKVFRRGEFVVGFTSSWRMGQLLKFRVNVAPQPTDQSDMAYMVGTYIEAVRSCFKDAGFATVENNEESGGLFLVGYKGKLYRVWGDYAVLPSDEGLAAVGCGDAYALAAMMALEGLPPRERIERALEISAHFSAGVRGPFYVVSSEDGPGVGGE